MARWVAAARQSFNQGVTSMRLNRSQATKLQNDIDSWATAIGTQRRKSFYPEGSRATFEVVAENHQVQDVQYSY